MAEHGGGYQIQQPLIPSLPNELAMECLLRIPHRFHSDLKLVCHGWRSLLSHSCFYSERRRLGAADHLIFLVQPLPELGADSYDMDVDGVDSPPTEKNQLDRGLYGPPMYTLGVYNLTRREWRRLVMGGGAGEIRIPMFCQVVALPAAGKLLLLGGWDPDTLEPVRDVYVVDLIGGSWRRGAPMAAARSFFAVAVVAVGESERVFVAGGHDGLKNALASAEVYDPAADVWAALPPMAEERDECLGMAAAGGFMVVSGYGTDSQGRFRPDAECFSLETGQWSKVDGVWPFSSTSPRSTAVGGRRWWWLSEQQEVKEFDWEKIRWTTARKIPVPEELCGGSSLCVVDVAGDGFFVAGNGSGSSGDGVFVVEDGGSVWRRVETPAGFLGFPFSSTQLLI